MSFQKYLRETVFFCLLPFLSDYLIFNKLCKKVCQNRILFFLKEKDCMYHHPKNIQVGASLPWFGTRIGHTAVSTWLFDLSFWGESQASISACKGSLEFKTDPAPVIELLILPWISHILQKARLERALSLVFECRICWRKDKKERIREGGRKTVL